MKVLTAAQMRRIDDRAEKRFGVPAETLMDNAGRAVADALMSLYPALSSMNPLILCGKGNNGGDGIALARHLKDRSIASRIVLLANGAALTVPAATHYARARKAGVAIEEVEDPDGWQRIAQAMPDHRLVVDALLGTGLNGPARGLPLLAIRSLATASAEIVALDIPSGLSGDTGEIAGAAVRADHTIALACPKIPHVFPPASGLVGRLHLVEIGIPPEAVQAESIDLNLTTESDVAPLVPAREREGHKGDYGRILVVGGSIGKTGAAALVCLSALRSGAGLVTAATPISAQPILAGHLMEAMTEALPETPAGAVSLAAAPVLRDLMQQSDVVAIGPGLTAVEETRALVREIVTGSALPIVLDADGLNAWTGRAGELSGEDRVLILTPHPGEMARLLSEPGRRVTAADVQADRVGAARAFARDHACYLVLKGHTTAIAEPGGQVWINPTGNPGMATGGSGDALTGVIAALLGQGLSPLESCLLGAYAHGLAGDLAAGERGEIGMIAGDLIDALPEAFLNLERA